MMNNKTRRKGYYIVKKLLKYLLDNIFISRLRRWFNVKVFLVEENMIIRYIPLLEGKGSAIEEILESYIDRNFIKKEQLLFNHKIVSFRKNEKFILLYCIRSNKEVKKLFLSHKIVKLIPFQEYISKKVIRKYPKEEKILAFYFGADGTGIVNVIYKKHLIYTCNIFDEDLDRIDEIIDGCSNHIINICSIKKEDWTVILINKGIDKVKSSNKNIKEMSLVRSC